MNKRSILLNYGYYHHQLKWQLNELTTALSLLNIDCVFPGVGFMEILGLVM